ncbi:MAG: hypothetical protein ACEQSA_02495 [Weeksellaceae bacterium]
MNYARYYEKAIWTNHAMDRLRSRQIKQEVAAKAFRYPDETVKGKTAGTYEFIKAFKKERVTVIAKQNDNKEWVIMSCWSDPIYPKRPHREQPSFWSRLWDGIRTFLNY